MAKRFLMVVAIGLAGCATEPAAQQLETPAVEVTLTGAVAKGPFLLGSSVAITPAVARAAVATTSGAARTSEMPTVPAEPRGDAQGQVFRTETSNDLGEFEIKVAYQGGALIEANGFYYNETSGELSYAPLTLRAFHEIGTRDEAVQVNLITHLTYQRVQALVAEGATVAEATEQAEGELHIALGFKSPAKAGSEISLIAGDDDASAYLFAVSAVFTMAGRTDAGIQELLNTTAAALATTGGIPAATRDRLNAARLLVDNSKVEAAYAARLAATGSTAEVPDLDRVIPWTIPTAVQACADAMPASIDSTCRLAACGNNIRGSDLSFKWAQDLVSGCDEACWAATTCIVRECANSNYLLLHDLSTCMGERCGLPFDEATYHDQESRAEWVLNTPACN